MGAHPRCEQLGKFGTSGNWNVRDLPSGALQVWSIRFVAKRSEYGRSAQGSE